jgi:chromosome segregation ATPase
MSDDPIADLTALVTTLTDRLAHVEQTYLEFLHRVEAVEESARSTAEVANSVDADRSEYKKRVDAVESACTSTADAMAKLDKRLKSVEGAIGGAAKAARAAEHHDKKPKAHA